MRTAGIQFIFMLLELGLRLRSQMLTSQTSEALMGHTSLKLVYYRQNDKARAKTYLGIEHALAIADTERIDKNHSELQKDNLELRGIVDSLSRQLRNLEKRINRL